jgi:PLP dependent protein
MQEGRALQDRIGAVKDGLAAVRQRMVASAYQAGRPPGDVRLILVSKKQPSELIEAAYAAGQREFGENYVQELLAKRARLPADIRWHMIGHLQSNKARDVTFAAAVHTVDSEKLGKALAKHSQERAEPLPVLVEVNVGREESKSGVLPENALALVQALVTLPPLRLVGLMCLPPLEGSRRWFAALRRLRDEISSQTGHALPELSMGTSADYEEAILEGATMVRVGRTVFGERLDA